MCGTLKILISYILGGEELHPLCHLVAEAQKVVVGQNGRVADDQVQSATAWSRCKGEITNRRRRREGDEGGMNGDIVPLLGKIQPSCDFMGWYMGWYNIWLYIHPGLWSQSVTDMWHNYSLHD